MLALYRVGGTEMNPDMPKNRPKGPLLLIHGNGQDASAWFRKNDEREATLAK